MRKTLSCPSDAFGRLGGKADTDDMFSWVLSGPVTHKKLPGTALSPVIYE